LPFWKKYLIFYAGFCVQAGAMVVFYSSARQRISLLPFFIFFAASVIAALKERTSHFLLIAALAVPLTLVFHREIDFMKEETHLWESIRLSNELLHQSYVQRSSGNGVLASDLSARALAAAPWLEDSRRPANLW